MNYGEGHYKTNSGQSVIIISDLGRSENNNGETLYLIGYIEDDTELHYWTENGECYLSCLDGHNDDNSLNENY